MDDERQGSNDCKGGDDEFHVGSCSNNIGVVAVVVVVVGVEFYEHVGAGEGVSCKRGKILLQDASCDETVFSSGQTKHVEGCAS